MLRLNTVFMFRFVLFRNGLIFLQAAEIGRLDRQPHRFNKTYPVFLFCLKFIDVTDNLFKKKKLNCNHASH